MMELSLAPASCSALCEDDTEKGEANIFNQWCPLLLYIFLNATIKSASNPNEKRRRVPQQQQVEKGRRPQERRNGGERETRGILSPVSRRPVLSCSSLTSLLRFAVAMEPATQSSNGVAREFCCFAKFGS
jgi:hypothetical protein